LDRVGETKKKPSNAGLNLVGIVSVV